MARVTTDTLASGQAMDRIYRYQRLIYDVTRRYYLIGRNDMIAGLSPPQGGSVLEVGCGTARNLIQAAKRYPSCDLYGFDISAEMLKTAAQSVARQSLDSRVTLAESDATDARAYAQFGQTGFDRIFISYSLSMIPEWRAVIERAADNLRPGGELHIVDFGMMQGLPTPVRSAMRAWLAAFSVTPRADFSQTVRSVAAARGLTAIMRDGRFGYCVHARIAAKP